MVSKEEETDFFDFEEETTKGKAIVAQKQLNVEKPETTADAPILEETPEPQQTPPPTSSAELDEELMEILRDIADRFSANFNDVVSMARSIIADPALAPKIPKIRNKLVKMNVEVRLQKMQKTKQVNVVVFGKSKRYWKRSNELNGYAYVLTQVDDTKWALGRILLKDKNAERLNKAMLMARYNVYVEFPDKKKEGANQNGANFLTLYGSELTDFENGKLISTATAISFLKRLKIDVFTKVQGSGGSGLSITNDKGYPIESDFKALVIMPSEKSSPIKTTPDDAPFETRIVRVMGRTYDGDESVRLWVPDFPEFVDFQPMSDIIVAVGTIAEAKADDVDADFVMNVIGVYPLEPEDYDSL